MALTDIPGSGQIVGTLVLSDVAGRADVAVSVAFPDRPDGSVFEPVAYRVELIATDDGWRVLAAGYL